ncbi:hypothetical protein CHLV4139_08665 [Campylobacter helveticus]|uniref:hypothetical protein n=1 Tax=Campylobacter helveticus TaxID=28898 RepID=UPI00214BE173|nr:hypothetical protein [Campylobacter helveticus]MCR2055557.1 hypothetical protein [Campylobacter helveticus]
MRLIDLKFRIWDNDNELFVYGNMAEPLLLTINCSISNKKNHLNIEQVKDLFLNIKHKKTHLNTLEKYAIDMIQTEAKKEEIEWFKEKYHIPQESIDNVLNSTKENLPYLSGWQALNIPNEKGITADWHPMFYLKEPLRFYHSNENAILGYKGIEKRFIASLGKEYFIASFARAIADLVYNDEFAGLKNCVNDFLDEEEENELFAYLKMMNKNKNVEDFMRLELTKLYFMDKDNA